MVRVLVVDDKSDIRLLLVAVLQRAGHEVLNMLKVERVGHAQCAEHKKCQIDLTVG